MNMENKTFTRQELYDLVWEKGMKEAHEAIGAKEPHLYWICGHLLIPSPVEFFGGGKPVKLPLLPFPAHFKDTADVRIDGTMYAPISRQSRKPGIKEEYERISREHNRRSSEIAAKERIEKMLADEAAGRMTDRLKASEEVAEALAKSVRFRAFVEECEKRITPSPGSDEELWFQWARDHADRIDPFKNGGVQKAIKRFADGLKNGY